MIKNTRKLSKTELRRIRNLISRLCANFDCETKTCLPPGITCRMLNIHTANECCSYFEHALLPQEPILLEAISDEFAIVSPDLCQKECRICGAVFLANKKQAYCSAKCRSEGERETGRKRVTRLRIKRAAAGH